MLGLPDIAVGVIVAALIAGVVSLLGLIISKEQKISEFRKAWIDSLRSEISALISHANAIHGARGTSLGGAEAWKLVRPDLLGINAATASIRLRLNPKEKEAAAVLTEMETLEKLFAPGSAMDQNTIDETEKRLVAKTQVLLKQEWTRVQQGEQVYRVAKAAALAVLIACVLALLAMGGKWAGIYEFQQGATATASPKAIEDRDKNKAEKQQTTKSKQ